VSNIGEFNINDCSFKEILRWIPAGYEIPPGMGESFLTDKLCIVICECFEEEIKRIVNEFDGVDVISPETLCSDFNDLVGMQCQLGQESPGSCGKDQFMADNILDSISDCFFALDRNWRFTYVNKSAEAFFRINREELIGVHYWERCPQILGTVFHRNYLKAMVHRETVNFHTKTIYQKAWLEVRAYPCGDGICVQFRDITAGKQAEKLLEETNERLIKVSEYKNEFLRNMGHELRTPLTAIIALASGLQMKQSEYSSERLGEYLNTILKNSKRLLGLINDLLDFSKAEYGKMSLNLSEVKIGDITLDTVKVLKPLAADKKIQIHMEIGDRKTVIADGEKVAQVVMNLIANAIKFSEVRGKVEVSVFNTAAPEGTFLVVSDSGPGIPEDEQDKIFDAFYQINRGSNKKCQGSGLGLAIVKKIMDFHLGKIEVSNRKKGKGAIFKAFWPSLPCFEKDLD